MAGTGVILCAANLPAQRRRFAIAHQLGHFLLRMHGGDRQCTHRDMAETRRDTPQRKEEMQANRFAAGLLMPKPWFNDLVTSLGSRAWHISRKLPRLSRSAKRPPRAMPI
jgi:Zn-dependent peptidase ImmA (M78 family)